MQKKFNLEDPKIFNTQRLEEKRNCAKVKKSEVDRKRRKKGNLNVMLKV